MMRLHEASFPRTQSRYSGRLSPSKPPFFRPSRLEAVIATGLLLGAILLNWN